jgi:hypothetical protein
LEGSVDEEVATKDFWKEITWRILSSLPIQSFTSSSLVLATMTAVVTLSTESVISELPSLSSTDHDNSVMMAKGDAHNATTSPMICSPFNSDSFDHWHKEHEWDDVVIIMGNDDVSGDGEGHAINMEEVLAADKHPSQIFLDSATVMVQAAAPSIDEFLVGCNDNKNNKEDTGADLNQYSRDFQVPRSMKHFSRGEHGNPASKHNAAHNGTANLKPAKTLTPNKYYNPGPYIQVHSNFVRAPSYINLALPTLSPPTRRSTCSAASFKELYRKRLQCLRESMHKSCKSRTSLSMRSPRVTEKYLRRTCISQVLYSIECSTRRIDACFLDPTYLDRGYQSPPKFKSTAQLQHKTESAPVATTREEKPARKAPPTE